jgi:hypothetical protein
MSQDLNNTLLALQLLNGVKLYSVRIAGPQGNATYSYKAVETYMPGDAVLVQTKNVFVAGIVQQEVIDFDYSIAAEWKWILFPIRNPEDLAETFAEHDRAAKRKLVQAQAMQAAKNMLEASGLSMTDLAGFLAPKE